MEITIDNKFVEDIGQWIKDNSQMMESKVRHGVSLSVNTILSKAKIGLMSTGLKVNDAMPEGGTLMQGIRGYMKQKTENGSTGVVTIMGNSVNDGTWRLRFFEGGTKIRIDKKSGKELGAINARWFFKESITNADSIAKTMIDNAIQEAINEINAK